MKVLFTGKVSLFHRDLIKTNLGDDFDCLFTENSSTSDFRELVKSVEVLVHGFPTLSVLAASEQLKMIIVPFTGFQQISTDTLEEIEKRKIILLNTPWNSAHTAQHTVALLLAASNRILPYHFRMKAGQWPKFESTNESIPLYERHVGLLGYGRINQIVHGMLVPFQAKISIANRTGIKPDDCQYAVENIYSISDLKLFLEAVDILVVSIPQNPSTIGLIGYDELCILGKNGILVSTARGPVIDEGGLYKALREKVIDTAAIDVWYNYHPVPDSLGRKYPWREEHPFQELDNLIMSPHRGASPLYHAPRWIPVYENLRNYLNGNILELTGRII
ncbi:MAG: hypothetical protein JXR95_14220 [Deltaproteobacteria bacterium]|nr:hypothetical protein [Deltaproteobacteria bacterium]